MNCTQILCGIGSGMHRTEHNRSKSHKLEQGFWEGETAIYHRSYWVPRHLLVGSSQSKLGFTWRCMRYQNSQRSVTWRTMIALPIAKFQPTIYLAFSRRISCHNQALTPLQRCRL